METKCQSQEGKIDKCIEIYHPILLLDQHLLLKKMYLCMSFFHFVQIPRDVSNVEYDTIINKFIGKRLPEFDKPVPLNVMIEALNEVWEDGSP